MHPKQEEVRRIILGVLLAGAALYLFLSLVSFSPYDPTFRFAQLGWPVNPTPANFGGRVGSYLAGFLFFLIGQCSYLLIVAILILGWNAVWGDREKPVPWWIGPASFGGLIVSVSALCGLRDASGAILPGGVAGLLLGRGLAAAFGDKGSILILGFLCAAFVAAGWRLTIEPVWELVRSVVVEKRERPPLPDQRKPEPRKQK